MELSDFYRQKRPEYFSDSTVESETVLPREILEFHIAQISTDQKQDEFETLVRRLLEKSVCPNLIPQVGPTGGGDGKTDIDTHSVSSSVSDRWFIPENGWDKDQKWAFAVSAKEDWVAKIKNDVAKIIATNRGYTKIFFITNQKPSSKKKKGIQDKFRENGIEVEIFDREWLLAKIYDGDALNIAVDSLNLSASHRQIKRVGPRDAERLKQLETLEKQIENPDRYFECDFQLVDDALQAAILSRMLEKPKDEVLGKFDRAIRLCNKLNSDKLRLRIHYQRAWTHIHWYDDLNSFIDDYKVVRQLVVETATIQEVELLNNLYTILLAQLKINPQDSIKIEEETYYITNILDIIEQDTTRLSSSLVAKTMKILNSIYTIDEKQDVSSLFLPLKDIFLEAKHHMDYPFETYSKSVQIYGDVFPDSPELDEVIDLVAETSAERDSEISSAMILLKRGYQKYENGLHKYSLVYFGKSLHKLAKEETEDALYFVLRGLSESYERLGLMYAAYCSQVAATSIAFRELYLRNKISKRMFNCVHSLANMGLMSGRITQFLLWRELTEISAKQISISDEEHTEQVVLLDSLLAVKLLHSDATTEGFSMMPDIFERVELWVSACAAFYKLGYVDKATNEISDTSLLSNGEAIEGIIRKLYDQPAGLQLPPVGINFYSSHIISLTTKILGCNIIFNVPANKPIIISIEGLLAYIESFFATSLKQFAPYVSEIIINVRLDETLNSATLSQPDEDRPYFELAMSSVCFTSVEQNLDYINVCAHLLHFFVGDDIKSYITNLYQDEEFHKRIAMLPSHTSFLRGIIGDDPKILLQDWSRGDDKNYPFVLGWKDNLVEPTKDDAPLADVPLIHSNTSVLSIINLSLWDKAGWMGLGLAHDRDLRELFILLPFGNIDVGKKIFEEWRANIGVRDSTNKIKIAIIQGIRKDHPAWYRVQIYSEPSNSDSVSDRFFIITSRMHTMIPETTNNIDGLKMIYKRLGTYKLCPVQMDSNNRIHTPYVDLFIEKPDIKFLNAWEIGPHSIHSAAIADDDDPIIPDNIENPPIVELLRTKKMS